MPTAVQFSIALDNAAGTLAKLCGLLKKAKINIEAISVSDNTDCGWVRIVASPSAKVRAVLHKAGYTVCAQHVLVVHAADKPGELERLCHKLSKLAVNVEYVYGSVVSGVPGTLVFGVSDVERAVKALGEDAA